MGSLEWIVSNSYLPFRCDFFVVYASDSIDLLLTQLLSSEGLLKDMDPHFDRLSIFIHCRFGCFSSMVLS